METGQIERQKHQRYKKTKHILGEGSYKTVTKAVDEEEGKEVAYNELRIRNYEIETKADSPFCKEIALLKTVDHQNILKIVDYWFSDENFIFVTELMTGGSLTDYIEKNGPLGIKLVRKWGKQILEGLAYLHKQEPPIIHRDIKCENIFVNAAVGEVKIGDLGLARERKSKRYTIVGTPHFMAREMFEGEGYTEKVDVYAFGMCLIEMATGKKPYMEFSDTKDIYKSVLQGVLPKALQLVTDPCLKSLIVSCLVPTAYRFTSSQCLDHHFFHSEVVCGGTCVPQEAVSVYPLLSEPSKAMELSIVFVVNQVVTFQIFLFGTLKFVKFEYDMAQDTVEKVCGELMAEKIVDQDLVDGFARLLGRGLEIVEAKMKLGKIHDGLIELNGQEVQEMQKRDIVICNRIETLCEVHGDSNSSTFGPATLEEMQLIEERMKIHAAREEIEKKNEEEISFRLKSKLQQKDASYEPNRAALPQEDSAMCEVELSKSVKFKNVARESLDLMQENVYLQFPNVANPELPADLCINSTSSMPQQLSETLGKIEQISFGGACEKALPVSSPPFSSEKVTEEQAVNDMSLSESYELSRAKYRSNHPIGQFVLDSAAITERSEDTAKSWLKSLKEEHIQTVFDLKLLAYEDWEKLPLTVFSCRAMQNMLYGLDGTPLREKQLPLNPGIRDYENKMKIRDFLVDVCEQLGRSELASAWESRLLAEDIQTVGELKSLHQDDWNRLGLPVLAFRVLKNTIQKKGKTVIDDLS